MADHDSSQDRSASLTHTSARSGTGDKYMVPVTGAPASEFSERVTAVAKLSGQARSEVERTLTADLALKGAAPTPEVELATLALGLIGCEIPLCTHGRWTLDEAGVGAIVDRLSREITAVEAAGSKVVAL